MKRRVWYNKRILFLVSALLCFALMEIGSRFFWRHYYKVPLSDPGSILFAFYPKLRHIDRKRPSHDDEFYDILILGGSVVARGWGQMEVALREKMAEKGHYNIRIFNLALPAYTSRDSMLQYAAMDDARFEMVVVYHGINETRANNVPPELFREDYAHYAWYETVNALASHHGATDFAAPYTLQYIYIKLLHSITRYRYVPTHLPRKEWIHYGQNPLSAVSFKNNLTTILDLAAHRNDRVMLMTFASHVPKDYSKEAFLEKRLNYTLHSTPIEIWGDRDNVLKTIAVHNEVVRDLANRNDDILFVDQASLMDGLHHCFNDPCHFTIVGTLTFTGHLLRVLLPTIQVE